MKRLILVLASFWLITLSSDAQVQVVVSTGGIVPLVYLKGDPKACDVRYTTPRVDDLDLAAPVKVNSEPGSAIATGK